MGGLKGMNMTHDEALKWFKTQLPPEVQSLVRRGLMTAKCLCDGEHFEFGRVKGKVVVIAHEVTIGPQTH